MTIKLNTDKDSFNYIINEERTYFDLLMQALEAEDLFKVERLLPYVCENSINETNEDSNTLLHLFIFKQNLSMVQTLLTYININVNQENSAGLSPLNIALLLNNLPIVQALLKHPKINVNQEDRSGFTPFHRAILLNNLAIVLEILNYKPIESTSKLDINKYNKHENISYLDLAFQQDNLIIVQALLKHPEIKITQNSFLDMTHLAITKTILSHYKIINAEKQKEFLELINLFHVTAGIWGINNNVTLHFKNFNFNDLSSAPPTSATLITDIFYRLVTTHLLKKLNLVCHILRENLLTNLEQFDNNTQIPIILSCGWLDHSINLIFWQNYLCLCNKNGTFSKKVFIWEYDKEKLTAEILKKIKNIKTRIEDIGKHFFYKELPALLNAQLLEDFSNAISSQVLYQKVNNCFYANIKLAIYTLFVLRKFDSCQNLNIDIQKLAKNLHKVTRKPFLEFRKAALQELIEEINQFNPMIKEKNPTFFAKIKKKQKRWENKRTKIIIA